MGITKISLAALTPLRAIGNHHNLELPSADQTSTQC